MKRGFVEALSHLLLHCTPGKFIWVECERGDVVLFNNMLFHSAGDNVSDIIRWSFDWR